ncbi:MAG TPA: choice-of-anchor A family protein [Polyangia bacterium]|jgi:Ricin-type beta-trefoil lectin domain.|nr:choice-of-anchor A family protein [Polyangia bacterium]
MRKQMRKLLWLRRSLGFLLGLALVSSLVLPPRSALAAAATEPDYFAALKDAWGYSTKVGGWISKGASAWNVADKILVFVGLLDPPLTLDDIKAEIERIAQYQDQQTKYDDLKLSDDPLSQAYDYIRGIQNAIHDGTFDRTNPQNVLTLNDIQVSSSSAVNLALAPHGLCTDLPIFGLMSKVSGQTSDYDWRMGMGEALKAVATRLVAMAVYDPTFKSPTSMWHDSFMMQLTEIRQCLEKHRDLIHPPKPFRYCHPVVMCGQAGCGCSDFRCGDYRPSVQWHVDQSSQPFPLCDDYYRGTQAGGYVPSYASKVAFEDVEANVEGQIDHNNLPAVFALQRMIDSLKIITSGQPDLAATNQLIRLGSNPALCLSTIYSTSLPFRGWLVRLDNCSSGSQRLNWSYDRATGRITNTSTGLCLSTAGPYTQSSVQLVTCTDADSDELQIWDWNPDSGVIKNSWNSVVAVGASIPQAGSSVGATVENPWYLNRQVWTNGVSTSCTGAICPAPGLVAWNQGTIGTTTQRYPIDFSIFAYMQAINLWDVAGPVAAHGGGPYDPVYPYPQSEVGGIGARYFSINAISKMPVALVAGVGDLGLSNGTVYGSIYYGPFGTLSIAPTVTRKGGQLVKTDTDTSPINFEMAFQKLQGMSSALQKYPANGTVTTAYGNITLSYSGNANPVVFAVKGSDLSNARSIQFQVSGDKTILTNVSGMSVAVQYAGFSVPVHPGNVLWNLYEALYFKTDSIGLPGSVLAPLAAAEVKNGAINGTMVAWSVSAPSGEFHWAPFNNNAMVGP